MSMVRFILVAALVATLVSGCKTTSPGVTSAQLSQIFEDRRSKGAMVGMSELSSSEYAIEFATPESQTPGAHYRYETFKIRKKELDPILRLKINQVAIQPGEPEPKKTDN
jgi:hypothetical protein